MLHHIISHIQNVSSAHTKLYTNVFCLSSLIFPIHPHFKREYCHYILPIIPIKKKYCHHILPIIHILKSNIAIISSQIIHISEGNIAINISYNFSTFFQKWRIVIMSCHSSRLHKENLLSHPIVHPSAIHHDQVQAPRHCKINLITTKQRGLLLANFVIERGILKEENSILTSARKSI